MVKSRWRTLRSIHLDELELTVSQYVRAGWELHVGTIGCPEKTGLSYMAVISFGLPMDGGRNTELEKHMVWLSCESKWYSDKLEQMIINIRN